MLFSKHIFKTVEQANFILDIRSGHKLAFPG